MVSVHGVRLRLGSPVCTRGELPGQSSFGAPTDIRRSGAATTASRLGQPDLAIATMNDFVEAGAMHASLDPTVPVIADADTGYAFGIFFS